MSRRVSPVVEGLEERALLSSLAYRLTTDQSVYQVGQPIAMTFTETNTGDQPLTVEVSPTDFSVSQNNTVIWQSDPANAGQLPTSETLLPGQSVSQTASWDGTETYTWPSLIGSSPKSSQINTFGSFVVSNPNAPAGLTATFQITDPIVSTVTTDQSVYQLGEQVQMTYTEVNTSDQSITIPHPQPAGFGITHNGTAVMIDAVIAIYYSGTETIAPGQVFTTSQTWNGIPIFDPSGPGDLTGTFVVNYGPTANDTEATTTFQIVAPSPDELATSVTTDQSVYQLGQPIQLTFTETNVGTTPVQVSQGPSSFNITQNGTQIWNSLVADLSPYQWQLGSSTWATLQPGQSYTQRGTWNGASDPLRRVISPGLSQFPTKRIRADTATFQIVAPATNELTSAITTDKAAYDLGEPAQFTFTETNTGNQPVVVLTGPTAFQITSNGTQLWASTAAQDMSASTTWQTLQPGQSYSQTTTWSGFDGYAVGSREGTGMLSVSNLLDPNGSSATIQILPTVYETQSYPPTRDPTPPTGTSISPIAVTLSTAPTFKLGRSVPLTLILKDVSLSKVAMKQGRHIETVIVQHGSTVVYESVRKARPITSKMMKQGDPLRLTTLWSGKPNQVDVRKLAGRLHDHGR